MGSDPAVRLLGTGEDGDRKRFLVRKQMEQTGLGKDRIEFADDGLNGLIQVLHARGRRPQPGARKSATCAASSAPGGQQRKRQGEKDACQVG